MILIVNSHFLFEFQNQFFRAKFFFYGFHERLHSFSVERGIFPIELRSVQHLWHHRRLTHTVCIDPIESQWNWEKIFLPRFSGAFLWSEEWKIWKMWRWLRLMGFVTIHIPYGAERNENSIKDSKTAKINFENLNVSVAIILNPVLITVILPANIKFSYQNEIISWRRRQHKWEKNPLTLSENFFIPHLAKSFGWTKIHLNPRLITLYKFLGNKVEGKSLNFSYQILKFFIFFKEVNWFCSKQI